jgi:hypothetical protein
MDRTRSLHARHKTAERRQGRTTKTVLRWTATECCTTVDYEKTTEEQSIAATQDADRANAAVAIIRFGRSSFGAEHVSGAGAV